MGDFNWKAYQSDVVDKRVKKHGDVKTAIVDMDATIQDLKGTIKGLREIINWKEMEVSSKIPIDEINDLESDFNELMDKE